MTPSGALGVIGVDRAVTDRLKGAFEESGLVDGVGVDRDLHIVGVGDPQAGVDRGRGRAPVLVQLEAAGASFDLVAEAVGAGAVAFAE